VEKLDVNELLAAVMAVIISIRAKIPSAIITMVMADLNLLDLILFHDKERVSLYFIFSSG